MKKNKLLLRELICALLIMLPIHLLASKVYTIDISTLDDEEIAAVLSLQGLANRSTPQLFIEPRKKGGFHGGGYQVQDVNVQRDNLKTLSAYTLSTYAHLEDVWKEHYSKTYQHEYENSTFEELFQTLASCYKGLVKYESINATTGIALAATSCGVLDGIPITDRLIAKHPFFQELPILEDLTTHQFPDCQSAYKWSMDNYLSKTSKEYAYSFWNHECNSFTIDYAVCHKLFSFNLSFANEKIHSDGDKIYPYNKEESSLLDRLFAHLHPGSIILGWGEPNEFILQARCGEGGHALLCTNVSPNTSFHGAIPVDIQSLKQKRVLKDEAINLENKIYITFSINEGDTYKSVGNLMMDGAWLHQQRGQIPFNWPINPKILQMFPALANYYYDSMSENDYFYVSTSGIGYYDATFSTPSAREVYAQKGKEAAAFADMHYMDVWWNNFPEADKWVASMGMKGYTTWTQTQRIDYFKAIPRIESDLYYDLYNPPTKRKASNMALYIKEQTASVANRPWFVHIYACDPTFAAEVMKNLPSDRFKAVCMDEFFALAVKGKSKVIGRNINKNEGRIKELIADSETERFVEEFSIPTKWNSIFATHQISEGNMSIRPDGANYYSQVTKENNKFNFDKYPLIAAQITQYPSNNIKWLLKFYDGSQNVVLNGTEPFRVEGLTDVFAWNILSLSSWSGIKSSNIQLILEATSATAMKGIEMKYDWIRSYESIEQLKEELLVSHILIDKEHGFTVTQSNGELTVSNIPKVESLKLFDLQGKMTTSSHQNVMNISQLKQGLYLLKINQDYTCKIFIN